MRFSSCRFRFVAALALASQPVFVFAAPVAPQAAAPVDALKVETPKPTVPFAGAGVVRDAEGKLLAGATLVVPNFISGPVAGTATIPALTDAQGHFTFASQVPAEIAAQIKTYLHPPEGGLMLPVIVYAPGFAVMQTVLKSGDGNDVKLARGGLATGLVRDADGKPIEGAAVRATFARLPNVRSSDVLTQISSFISLQDFPENSAPERAFSAKTDADGRWTLPDLPLGASVTVALDDSRFVSESVSTTVSSTLPAPGDTKGLLTAHPGARVKGRALYPNGKPVVGARVMASNNTQNSSSTTTTTGADGTYTLMGLGAGQGTVSIQPPSGDWVTSSAANVQFVAGEEMRAPDITLSQGVVLTGRVLETDSKAPVVGAQVNANGVAATSDAKGVYQLRVPLGDLQIYVPQPPPDFVHSWSPVSLTVSAQTKTVPDISLRRGQTLSGTAKDDNGKPVVGAVLSVSNNGPNSEATTDANGNWTLRGLDPNSNGDPAQKNRVRLKVQGAWAIVGATEIRLPSPPLALTLHHLTLQNVTVRVENVKGQPIPEADVSYKLFTGADRNSYENQTARANDKGEIVLRDLRPDQSAELTATKTGYAMKTPGSVSPIGDLTPDAGVLRAKNVIMLPLDAQVSGRVLDASGQPVVGARVASLLTGDLRDLPDATVQTDATGHFTLANLAEGEVTLGVAAGRAYEQRVVTTGQTLDVTLPPDAATPPPHDVEGAFLLLEKWAADARAKGLKPGEGRSSPLISVASSLAAFDSERAARAMIGTDGKVSDEFAAQAPLKLARVDPAGASKWGRALLATLPAEDRADASLQLAALTAKADPKSARDAYDLVALNMTPGAFSAEAATRYALLAAAAGALDDGDMEAWTQALTASLSTVPPDEIGDRISGYARTLSAGGAKTLQLFLSSLSPTLRVRAICDAMPTIARRDLPFAKTLLAQTEALVARPDFPVETPKNDNRYRPAASDLLNQARAAVARALLPSDPQGALDVLSRLPQNYYSSYLDIKAEAQARLALKGNTDARGAALNTASQSSQNPASSMARVASLLSSDDKNSAVQTSDADWRAVREKLAAHQPDEHWGEHAAAYAFYRAFSNPAEARLLVENEWLRVQEALRVARAATARDYGDYQLIQRLDEAARAMIPLSLPRTLELLPDVDASDTKGYYGFSSRQRLIEWLLATDEERRAVNFDDSNNDTD